MRNAIKSSIGKCLTFLNKFGKTIHMEARETKQMLSVYTKLFYTKVSGCKKTKMCKEELEEAWIQVSDLPKILPFFIIFFLPVPGIVEVYLAAVIALEKLSKGRVKLLPTQFYIILLATENTQK